jgi:hypothetical protein
MIPTPLPYPIFSTITELHDKALVYVVKKYEMSGISIIASRVSEGFMIRVADWVGNLIDPTPSDDINKILLIIKHARIAQSQWYFSGGKLVDIRKSIDSFVGPGMLRDLCGKVFDTQEVIEIGEFGSIKTKSELKGSIIKPARFRTIAKDDELIPLYGILGD